MTRFLDVNIVESIELMCQRCQSCRSLTIRHVPIGIANGLTPRLDCSADGLLGVNGVIEF